MFYKNSSPGRERLGKNANIGLSFMELIISIFILSMVFLFCLPFFINSKYAITKEGMVIQATATSQGIIDRIKKLSHAYDSTDGKWYYEKLQDIYNMTNNSENIKILDDNIYKRDTSYIIVEDVTGSGTPPPGNVAKRVTVHLEWIESHGGKAQLKEFTNVGYISKPSIAFARDPSAQVPPSIPTTSITSTSTTSTTSTSTTRTTSTSTSSTRTTSTSTTSTTSTSTSSTRTTSISTTSISTSRSTSVSTSSTTSTSTTSTRSTSRSTTTSNVGEG